MFPEQLYSRMHAGLCIELYLYLNYDGKTKTKTPRKRKLKRCDLNFKPDRLNLDSNGGI